MALKLFRSEAKLRLARMKSRHWAVTRSDPLENHARSTAQSKIAGLRYRDGSTNPGTLTLAQAQDVLTWVRDNGF